MECSNIPQLRDIEKAKWRIIMRASLFRRLKTALRSCPRLGGESPVFAKWRIRRPRGTGTRLRFRRAAPQSDTSAAKLTQFAERHRADVLPAINVTHRSVPNKMETRAKTCLSFRDTIPAGIISTLSEKSRNAVIPNSNNYQELIQLLPHTLPA